MTGQQFLLHRLHHAVAALYAADQGNVSPEDAATHRQTLDAALAATREHLRYMPRRADRDTSLLRKLASAIEARHAAVLYDGAARTQADAALAAAHQDAADRLAEMDGKPTRRFSRVSTDIPATVK